MLYYMYISIYGIDIYIQSDTPMSVWLFTWKTWFFYAGEGKPMSKDTRNRSRFRDPNARIKSKHEFSDYFWKWIKTYPGEVYSRGHQSRRISLFVLNGDRASQAIFVVRGTMWNLAIWWKGGLAHFYIFVSKHKGINMSRLWIPKPTRKHSREVTLL